MNQSGIKQKVIQEITELRLSIEQEGKVLYEKV